ncbi:MAG: hypothetical protein LBG43_02960 [Treponema sp.]|jgi:GNAT superfamily N-acetyltransferase|nr:hypothetical protein [Treponema sp.]
MIVYNKRREALEVTVRLAQQEDAPDIIALLIKQHGACHPNADLYNTDFLRTAIAGGDIYVAVAELENGLLLGIAGANRKNQFAGALELGMMTIHPDYRGFGMGKHLSSFLLESLTRDAYACNYCHCMSLDIASQKISTDLGFRITGMILNCYRTDPRSENFSGLDIPFKHTLVVVCRAGSKRDAGPLYAPLAHTGYIDGVYDGLGVAYTLMEDQNRTPEGPASVRTVTLSEKHRYCEVLAKRIGPDFERILEDILDRYGHLEGQTFNVLINLNDSSASWACRLLEEWGFFFTGIHPLSGPCEYIIFHCSLRLPVPFDRIAVLPEFTEGFAYIRSRYDRSR